MQNEGKEWKKFSSAFFPLFCWASFVSCFVCYLLDFKTPFIRTELSVLISISLLTVHLAKVMRKPEIEEKTCNPLSLLFVFSLEIAFILERLGLKIPEKIHWSLNVGIIVLGALLLWSFVEKKNPAIRSTYSSSIKKRTLGPLLNVFLVTIVILTSLYFSTKNLGEFITRDEPRWINYFQTESISPSTIDESNNATFINTMYARTVGYWNSYITGRTAGTLVINAGSGVMTSVLELPSYFFQQSEIETYLFLSRFTFVLFNLILIICSGYFLNKLTIKKAYLLFLVLVGLSPMFIGFSRIVNHDSITGTLICTAFLGIMVGLKQDKRRFFLFSGMLYGCAVLTSGKAAFALPLLWLTPSIYSLAFKEAPDHIFKKNLFWLFLTALGVMLLFFPAVILYPELIVTKLLFPGGPIGAITILLFASTWNTTFSEYKKQIVRFAHIYEKYIVRMALFCLIGFAVYVSTNLQSLITLGGLSDISLPLNIAIGGTGISFFYSLPLILVVLFSGWTIYYFIKPKMDVSVISMLLFMSLLGLSILGTYKLSTLTAADVEGTGFLVVNKRYQMNVLFFFLLSISTWELWAKVRLRYFYSGLGCIALSLIVTCVSILPNYLFFTNALFFGDRIPYSYPWGIGVYEAAQYINSIVLQGPHKTVKVFDPYGSGYRFFDLNQVELVNFPIQAEYIILNRYAPGSYNQEYASKAMIRENAIPIWSYKIGRFDAVSIYKVN